MATTGETKSSGSKAYNGKTPQQWNEHWTKEMQAAEKRLNEFVERGNKVTRKFLSKSAGAGDAPAVADGGGSGNLTDSALNLFWSNIKTKQAMLYGSTPKIDVSREHHDPGDDAARVASVLLQRILQASVDPSGDDAATALKSALQDRLIPGMGIARVRYEFDTDTRDVPDPMTGEVSTLEYISEERAPIDYVHWQDFRWGWGRRWGELPWIAYRSWFDKEEFKERFGKDALKGVTFALQTPSGSKDDATGAEADQKSVVEKAEIWEIWCKKTKHVCWWSPGAATLLDHKKDPLKLNGFWPSPKPLAANLTTTQFMPRADYLFAQDLYAEIDTLQSRIMIITDAVKVVGVYDKSATASVGRMLKEGNENELIPVDNWAMFAEKGGIKGTVDWFPVEEIVRVLATLRDLLNSSIQLLYELTGMSDILRGGNTDQYTSDGTNQLKAKFGSIHIQELQDDFARFASDLESLKAEVVSKHFTPASIYQQSNAEYIAPPDVPLVPTAIQLLKSPNVKWRINIKPETLAMVDYAQLKAERTEFLTAIATFIQSAATAGQNMPQLIPLLLEVMKWAMAGFKASDDLEGFVDQAVKQATQMLQQQAQGQEGPSPEQLKLQLEQMKQQGQQAKQQGEIQKLQLKRMGDLDLLRRKLAGEIEKIRVDNQADITLEEVSARNRMAEIMRNLEADLANIQASMNADLTVEQAQAEFDIASQTTEHEHNMREIEAQNRRNADSQ